MESLMPKRSTVGSGIQSPHSHYPEPAGLVTRKVMRKPDNNIQGGGPLRIPRNHAACFRMMGVDTSKHSHKEHNKQRSCHEKN